MRGVIDAYAVFQNGSYKAIVDCKDLESFLLLERKLRLIGVFITMKKGF
jgi:hypothetical protein